MTKESASGPLWAVPGSLDLALVEAGYVALKPARRGHLGSEGWTTTYTVRGSSLRAGDVILGAYDEAADVVAAFAYLRECPFVDPRRIAIGGHSLGGLVTMIGAAQLPDVRAVASVNGGISWTEDGMQTGYPAVTQVWARESRKIKAPVLVLQGTEDTQIKPEMGESLAEILRKRSVPVDLVLYAGGHQYFPHGELIKFLNKHLKRQME